MTIMGGLSCHMRRQKSTRVPGSGPIIINGKNIHYTEILKSVTKWFTDHIHSSE